MNAPPDIHCRVLASFGSATIVIATLDGLLEGFFWIAPFEFSFMVMVGSVFGQIPGFVFVCHKQPDRIVGFAQTTFLITAYFVATASLLAYCYLLFTEQPQHEMTTMFAWVIATYFAFWSYFIALVVGLTVYWLLKWCSGSKLAAIPAGNAAESGTEHA